MVSDYAQEVARRFGVPRLLLTDTFAAAVESLAPAGWALSGHWNTDGLLAAKIAAEGGASREALDELISENWNSVNWPILKNVTVRVRGLGAGENALSAIMWRRAELLDKAIAHHAAGAYEASILLTHAQIDGMSRDLADGKSFFSKKEDDLFVDDETLAGLENNLPIVRAVFSEDVRLTGSYGKLSRHGAAHGRDLTYATKVNSTKSLVLLVALVEHLPKLARTKADEARAKHEEQVAGSTELDAYGRLVDDREVPELLSFAYDLSIDYMNHVLLNDPFDLEPAVQKRAAEARLDPEGIIASRDGEGYWWHYTLPAGQVLGMAERPSTNSRRKGPDRWRWDHPAAPGTPPWEDPDGWRSDDDLPFPPNWEPRLSFLNGS